MSTGLAAKAGPAGKGALTRIQDLESEIRLRQRDLADAQEPAREAGIADREAFLMRFSSARATINSSNREARIAARRVIMLELRKLIQGFVLHPNRTISLQMKQGVNGRQTIYLLTLNGLDNIYVKHRNGRLSACRSPWCSASPRVLDNFRTRRRLDRLSVLAPAALVKVRSARALTRRMSAGTAKAVLPIIAVGCR